MLEKKDKVGDAAKIDGSREFASPVFAVMLGNTHTKKLSPRNKDTVRQLTEVAGPCMVCAYMLVGVRGLTFQPYPDEYGVQCCDVGDFVVAVYHHICACPMLGDNVVGWGVTSPQQINGVDTSDRSSDRAAPLEPSEYYPMLEKFRGGLINEMSRLLRQSHSAAEAESYIYQLHLNGVAE
jgi:hypothetical protein